MRVSSGADDRPEVIRSAYNASPGRVDFYIEQIFGGNSQEPKDESSSGDGGVGSTSFIVLLSTNSFICSKPTYQIYEREIFQKFSPSSKQFGAFDALFSPFPCLVASLFRRFFNMKYHEKKNLPVANFLSRTIFAQEI